MAAAQEAVANVELTDAPSAEAGHPRSITIEVTIRPLDPDALRQSSSPGFRVVFDQITRCFQRHERIKHRACERAEAVQFVDVNMSETFDDDAAAHERVQLCQESICPWGLFG